ncbi:DNA gyrase inhibitor [Metabacillus litoralis]|uniref:DNA gyrase inhibitor n=1 Tax=Metabacillus litoralis TaxID=152268 RepID=A0A5C6W4G0_9BACI|nr:GyrI-like domain-containing protein [Metabacillus litoralis]TXC92837.1 DNA gyrase inhibitor [Metabacillus litoralis]
MNFKIETISNDRIAYMRRVGPYGPANTEVMEKLKNWAKEKNLLLDTEILFAIAQDNPVTTFPENCRFDACIVIPENFHCDDSVSEGELTGGKYMICEVKHTADAIQKAYSEIFQLLQMHGYQMENKPMMEKYIGDPVSNPYCEICIPIKP